MVILPPQPLLGNTFTMLIILSEQGIDPIKNVIRAGVIQLVSGRDNRLLQLADLVVMTADSIIKGVGLEVMD